MSKPKTRTSVTPPPAKPEGAYPSVSELGLSDHIPTAIDLRPYFPEVSGDTFEHHVSSALVAAFARTGRPLPFVPSPEHLQAIGGVEGIGKFGVRELGVKMGEPPTEYDLTADAIPLDLKVYSVEGTSEEKVKLACIAFAAGHVVRIGDAFLVAYGPDGLVTTSGPIEDLDDRDVQVWSVSRP